jgi:anthranilate synthase/aminodeoxychorismate synthase-like glutamine amidotransferase
LEEEVAVYRNDDITIEAIQQLKPDSIFLSPGPGEPKDAGVTVEVIKNFHRTIPIMGICLGHQAIGYAFGAEVVLADSIMHGKTSGIINDGETIFKGLPSPFDAGRYHSLVLKRSSLPPSLCVSAETADGEVMGIRHRHYPVEGVQFHPESILTPKGKRIMRNFLELRRKSSKTKEEYVP